AIDNDRPRTDHLYFLQDVGRKNDRLGLAHPPDQRPHLVLLIWVEPFRWFIHDQNLGIVNNRLRKTDPMLIPFRQRLYALAPDRFEKTDISHAVERFLFRLTGKTAQLGRETEETFDCH